MTACQHPGLLQPGIQVGRKIKHLCLEVQWSPQIWMPAHQHSHLGRRNIPEHPKPIHLSWSHWTYGSHVGHTLFWVQSPCGFWTEDLKKDGWSMQWGLDSVAWWVHHQLRHLQVDVCLHPTILALQVFLFLWWSEVAQQFQMTALMNVTEPMGTLNLIHLLG